jgi:hypothetical protein
MQGSDPQMVVLLLRERARQKAGLGFARTNHPDRCTEMTKVILRQNRFGRWILIDASAPAQEQIFAWSGSRWVEIDRETLDPILVQISNFETRASAATYAGNVGFQVIVE